MRLIGPSQHLPETETAFDHDTSRQSARVGEWLHRRSGRDRLATALVPGAATAILCSLEATMCYQIGMLYRHDWKMSDAIATAGVIGLASLAAKIAALEAAILAGPFAFVIKPAIVGAIVKAMGELVIKHFEDADQLKRLN